MRGILTNGLAAPVITNANYSGSVRTSLKLILPPSRRSVLSGAKGASRLAADWPLGMTRKCPNMASYLISPLAMGRLPLSWNARNVITTSVTVYSINPNSTATCFPFVRPRLPLARGSRLIFFSSGILRFPGCSDEVGFFDICLVDPSFMRISRILKRLKLSAVSF